MAPAGSVRFLLNPAAGRGAAARARERLAGLAAAAGAELAVSASGTDVTDQARRAAGDGIDRLLVVGGDGTMHRAAQGLAGTRCCLGVIPLGTGNDLAHTLGVPVALEAAVACALAAPPRPIDLVRVGQTVCIGYAGVGFDSEVTRFANEQVRLLRGPLVYCYAVIRTLVSFKAPHLEVRYDGGSFSGRAMFAVVANLPRFGGGMRIAPEAVIDDGVLDLVVVEELSRLALLAVFPKVYSGNHATHPAVHILRTRRAEITLDRALTLYGGGEPVIALTAGQPAVIEVVPGGLSVVA